MKSHEFEFEVDPILVTLDVDYHYHSEPSTNYEEGEVTLSGNWQDKIREAFLKEAEQAIRSMQDRLMDLEFDNMPRKWAMEDAENWKEAA